MIGLPLFRIIRIRVSLSSPPPPPPRSLGFFFSLGETGGPRWRRVWSKRERKLAPEPRRSSLLSSCPDAVTGVAGCWIVSLSRARACRREALPFLLPLSPNHVSHVALAVDDVAGVVVIAIVAAVGDHSRSQRRAR